jgi:hypothetical protein
MTSSWKTRSPLTNQHAGKTSILPSVGADVSGIETLLKRNLPEVFGEGDSARRRAAIQELYTEDCVLYAPPGTFVGHDALDKFAGVGFSTRSQESGAAQHRFEPLRRREGSRHYRFAGQRATHVVRADRFPNHIAA